MELLAHCHVSVVGHILDNSRLLVRTHFVFDFLLESSSVRLSKVGLSLWAKKFVYGRISRRGIFSGMLVIFGHGLVIVVRVMAGQAWSVLGDGVSATAGRRVTGISLRLVGTADGCGLRCNKISNGTGQY